MGREERVLEVSASRLESVIAVCANIQDPHNAAAILRTCEALGILEVWVIEEDVPFVPSPKVTRGAEEWLWVRRFRQGEKALAELRARGFRVYAATPEGRLPLEELPLEVPLALAFGNESTGFSPDFLSRCDGTFRIPMWGFSRSLNVSVAAGIALYVVGQAKRRILGQGTDLSRANPGAAPSEAPRGPARTPERPG